MELEPCKLATCRLPLPAPAPVPCPPLWALPLDPSSDRIAGLTLRGPSPAGPSSKGTVQLCLGVAAPVNPWRPAWRGRRKLQEADVPLRASGVAGNPRLLCTSEAQEAESRATLGLYSPPASCRRCASGPPRRSRAHGRPLLHAPEPGGQVWARPMGPPAPSRAAPGRLKARCRRTPSAALRPGAPEQADSTAPDPRSPAPGPWSQDCGAALAPASLFFCLHRKGRSKKRQREMIKLLEAGR